jgi:hypothetical protein
MDSTLSSNSRLRHSGTIEASRHNAILRTRKQTKELLSQGSQAAPADHSGGGKLRKRDQKREQKLQGNQNEILSSP